MTALPRRRAPYTVDDLALFPDDGNRYEIIDGSLFVTPAPRMRHQRAVARLLIILDAACGDDHEVFPAPTDFHISTHDVTEPDLIVAERANISERGIEQTTLLVVEVLSPGTATVDRTVKRAKYAQAGVPAYWLVDPDEPSLTVLRLVDDAYVEEAVVRGDETYRSDWPLHGLTVVPAALVRDRG